MASLDNNEVYESILQHLVDGVIVINQQGTMLSVNEAVLELFNYREEELIGNNVSMLANNKDAAQHDGYIRNYVETGHKKIIGVGREVEGRRKDGSLFPFRLAISEVRVGEDRVFTGILHDLTALNKAKDKLLQLNKKLELKVEERTVKLQETVNSLLTINHKLNSEIAERKRVEEQLNASLEKEKELHELKSKFVTMASHEFKTPLATILSSANLISKYPNEEQLEKRNKHINRIQKSISYLEDVLEDFLSLRRIEEQAVHAQLSLEAIAPIIEEAVDIVSSQLREGQIVDLTIELDPPSHTIDRHMLKNALINLLSNAVKYSPEQNKILLKASNENAVLQIAVQDFGMGITASDQKHLFERFYRGKNAENLPGTGIGLNICKRYIEMMNGELSFVSELDEGSTFTITIP